jgi:hypothetical protein
MFLQQELNNPAIAMAIPISLKAMVISFGFEGI